MKFNKRLCTKRHRHLKGKMRVFMAASSTRHPKCNDNIHRQCSIVVLTSHIDGADKYSVWR